MMGTRPRRIIGTRPRNGSGAGAPPAAAAASGETVTYEVRVSDFYDIVRLFAIGYCIDISREQMHEIARAGATREPPPPEALAVFMGHFYAEPADPSDPVSNIAIRVFALADKRLRLAISESVVADDSMTGDAPDIGDVTDGEIVADSPGDGAEE